MSEELENSLQQAIESYLNDRLRAIDEQLVRLQAEFNEGFARLRESSASGSLEATPASAAISAHLQAAREQKLAGEERVRASEQVAKINRAVEDIEKQPSQADALGALLTNATRFAERVALFVVKNEQAIGWRACEASDTANFESIRGITLPLTAYTLVSHAARSRSPWSGVPGSNSEDSLLIDQLGGEPQSVAAVPLVVRGKVVAVLYADSTSSDPDAINVDALELLARIAGMAVDLVSVTRTPPPSQASEPDAARQHAVPEKTEAPPAPAAAQPAEAEALSEPEPGYRPEIEPQAPEMIRVSDVEVSEAPEVEVAEVSDIEVSAEPPAAEISRAEGPVPESVSAPTVEPELVTQPIFEPPAPSLISQYATPLGSARRYGVAEPELPIEVGEEERLLHNDARRFARLLVSEIKLYNEQKLREGRSQSNIYDRLREDIDRSRQMYDKRVAPPVAARHDYFHQELVNTLAEGDSSKLGASYPGAAFAVT